MQSIEEKNKTLVLEAFETLFNQRDYNAAERFWSPNYIQHSAHIPPGRESSILAASRVSARAARLRPLTKPAPTSGAHGKRSRLNGQMPIFRHGGISRIGRQ